MNKRYWLTAGCLLSLLTAAGCTETESDTNCDPACGDNETCVGGVCEPNMPGSNVCEPACGNNETCINGTCKPNEDSTCNLTCGDDKTCINGTCKPNEDSTCNPTCGDDETCINGTCEPNGDGSVCDPACGPHETCVDSTCQVAACSSNSCLGREYYCGTAGTWEACELGTGCHMGVCLPGLGKQCNAGTCSKDGRAACVEDAWYACGSLETCIDGECVLTDETCEPGTCSLDNLYRCTAEGRYEGCKFDETCVDGACISDVDRYTAMLWTLCKRHSDCTGGYCLFDIATSKPLTNRELGLVNAEKISVTKLDSRIPDGYGICATDCTKDAASCNISNSGSIQYSCHVAVVGDSPYPPKGADNELPLPFHKELDKATMRTGAPFAAICRPNDVANLKYENTFCMTCNADSECGESELCVGRSCVPKCTSDSMCPIGFKCGARTLDGAEEEEKVCIPPAWSCAACADPDGDGQGYGHCTDKRFDCAPLDKDINYQPYEMPKVCSETTDTNCNGKIDSFELLGSAEHCRFCDDPCSSEGDEAGNVTSGCKIKNGVQMYTDSDLTFSQIDDYAYATTLVPKEESTHLTFCSRVCVEGYADCDGRVSNGCEVKIIEYERQQITEGEGEEARTQEVITNVKLSENIPIIKDRYNNETSGKAWVYTYDQDKDGYYIDDPTRQTYCCDRAYTDSPDKNTTCYAFPRTRYNNNTVWDVANTDEYDIDYGDFIYYRENMSFDDCDDENYDVKPGVLDVCDGIDNDCNPATPDGDNSFYRPSGKDPGFTYYLGDKCSVLGANNIVCNENGVVTCVPEKKKNLCLPENSGGMQKLDNTCDAIDDDCDGIMDEDFPVALNYVSTESDGKKIHNPDGSINICNYRITVCEHKQVDVVPHICGDNVIQGTEECDDGNTKDGDGCSSTCKKEPGYTPPNPDDPDAPSTSDLPAVLEWRSELVTYSLFTPRERDFYGDGIDSNCDGYDYDFENAVFINKYGSEGEYSGNDNHKGTALSPYASLNKALQKACKVSWNRIGSQRCDDIFISASVSGTEEKDDPWAKTPINLPFPDAMDSLIEAVNMSDRGQHRIDDTAPWYINMTSLQEIVCAVTGSGCEPGMDEKKKQKSPCQADGCANEYEFTNGVLTEKYAPRERIRIYGGWTMDVTNGKWDAPDELDKNKSRYKYVLPADFNSYGEKFIPLISQADGMSSKLSYTPNGAPIYSRVGFMSVKFENMAFTFDGSNYHSRIPEGITMVGLTCGPAGCSELTFDNTTIEVTGAKGFDATQIGHETNNNYEEVTSDVKDTSYVVEGQTNGINARLEIYKDYLCKKICRTTSYYYDRSHKLCFDQTSSGDFIGVICRTGVTEGDVKGGETEDSGSAIGFSIRDSIEAYQKLYSHNVFYTSRYSTKNLYHPGIPMITWHYFADKDDSPESREQANGIICPDGASPLGGMPGAGTGRIDTLNGLGNDHPEGEIRIESKFYNGKAGRDGGRNREEGAEFPGETGIPGGAGGDIKNKDTWNCPQNRMAEGIYDAYSCQNDMGTKGICAGNGRHGSGGVGGSFFTPEGKLKKVGDKNIFSIGMGTYGLVVNSNISLGYGTVGASGSGGGGGGVNQAYDPKPSSSAKYDIRDESWLHGGSGGYGGCAGRGGQPGGTGASVIGLHLNPPSMGSELKLTVNNVSTENLLTLMPGRGGDGQPGQSGRYGGWRGMPVMEFHEDRCYIGGAGGVGGTGGGGGGGAGGLAGQAYGLVFICNRPNVEINKNHDLAKCGYSIEEGSYINNVFNYPESYIKIAKVAHGTSGDDGVGGADPENSKSANTESNNGGAGGSSEVKDVDASNEDKNSFTQYIYYFIDKNYREK